MNLNQYHSSNKPVVSFEFFPPKTEAGDTKLLETARRLAVFSPGYFSMTYGAGGSTQDKTVQLAHSIQRETGVDTVCHLTCVSQSRDEVRSVLRDIESLGMKNVLALRGDPSQSETDWRPHPDGFHYAAELVREIRNRSNGLSVGVAGFPEEHPDSTNREDDLRHLVAKIDCGADVVISQLFFNNEDFYRFDRDLKAMGVTVPIIPGVIPILNAPQIRRFCQMCQAKIPPPLSAELERYETDETGAREFGVRYATRQIEELLTYGAPGVHLYCLNRTGSVEAILKNLALS